jgi:hypothetical protein
MGAIWGGDTPAPCQCPGAHLGYPCRILAHLRAAALRLAAIGWGPR